MWGIGEDIVSSSRGEGTVSGKLKSREDGGRFYSLGGVPWLWQILLQEAKSLLWLSILSNG